MVKGQTYRLALNGSLRAFNRFFGYYYYYSLASDAFVVIVADGGYISIIEKRHRNKLKLQQKKNVRLSSMEKFYNVILR